MNTKLSIPELVVSEDLQASLAAATAEPVDDRSLLDPAFQDQLTGRVGVAKEALHAFAAEVRTQLESPPHFTVVKGIAFDPGNVALAIIASAVGRPVQPYPDPTFTVLRELRPRDASRAPGWGVLTEWLHTDSTNWRRPHDVTMLQCRHVDQRAQGASLILPVEDAVAEIAGVLGDDAVTWLNHHDLPWAVDPSLGGGTCWAPALAGGGVRWQLFRIAQAVERDGAPCDEQTMAFLREVDRTLCESARLREFVADTDDLLILHNRQVLHARRPVAQPETSQRSMIHAKVDFRATVGDPTATAG